MQNILIVPYHVHISLRILWALLFIYSLPLFLSFKLKTFLFIVLIPRLLWLLTIYFQNNVAQGAIIIPPLNLGFEFQAD